MRDSKVRRECLGQVVSLVEACLPDSLSETAGNLAVLPTRCSADKSPRYKVHIDALHPQSRGQGVADRASGGNDGLQRSSGLSASRPSNGPRPSHGKSDANGTVSASDTNSRMLAMETPKPMLLVSVSTLPTLSCGEFIAVSVENCGESPATVMPHSSSQPKKKGVLACNIHGAAMQHKPLMAS